MKKLWLMIHVAFFWIILILVGVFTVLRLSEFSSEKNTPVLNGEWVTKFETYLDDHLAIKDWGVNVWAAVEYTVFGEGSKGVVIGREQWLFTDEEFYEAVESEKFLQENLVYISDIAARLASQDVGLLVVLVPAKADIYKHYLKNARPSAFMLRHFDSVAEKLTLQIPNVVNLRDVFSKNNDSEAETLFLRTDTHWSVVGAKLAAEAIAERVAQESIAYASKKYETDSVSSEDYLGDLTKFIPLQPHLSMLMPAPDILVRTQTRMMTSAAGGKVEEDLFGDQQAELVLVGTSYSANKNWNFEGALKQYLSGDLINFSSEGEGPFAPMMNYLKSPDFIEMPPRLVIWEIPVRYLVVDYSALNIVSEAKLGMNLNY